MRKMNSYRSYVLCIVIFGLLSCNKTKKNGIIGDAIINAKTFELKQDNKAITIDMDKVDETELFDLIKKIRPTRFIKLDNKELIGAIDKLIIAEERIYVLDAFSTERVLIYDFNGNLSKKIESKGHGPKDYGGLDDMFYDKKNNNLILNDRLIPKLLFYTAGGDFIKKSNSIPSTQFATLNQKNIFKMTFGQSFEKNINYGIIGFEHDSIITKGFELLPSQKSIPATRSLILNGLEEILFTPNGSDTVYKIIDEYTYQVKYIFKHEKSIWDYIKSNESEQLTYEKYKSLIINDDYSCFSGELLETKNFLCFVMNEKPLGNVKRPYLRTYYYNKSNKVLFTLKQFNESEIDSKNLKVIGAIIPPPPISIFENNFVSVLNPQYILHLQQGLVQNKISIINNELRKMIIDFPVDGNPILMLYSIY